jgi:hypothetical protein
MTVYAYDVEVFRNLFTATFVNVADKSEVHAFYTGIDKLDRTDLLKFLKSKITLVGYNNHMYDDPVLRFAMFYKGEDFNGELYKLSSKLVDDNYRSDRALLKLRYPRDVYIPWDSIDLMKMLAFDKLGISLKQISINLKWHMIMDMPIDHMKKVDAKDLPLVLKYNKNDVLITDRLYEVLEPERKLREELSKLYHVDLRSASDSKMANLILEHIYVDELKTDIREIREKRTFRDTIFLSDCVAPFVEFKSPYLNEVLNRLKSKKVE